MKIALFLYHGIVFISVRKDLENIKQLGIAAKWLLEVSKQNGEPLICL